MTLSLPKNRGETGGHCPLPSVRSTHCTVLKGDYSTIAEMKES